jgi:anti-sigma factor RsiW
MSLSEPFDDRLMADLAAAADGTLPPARRAELDAMAAADAELAEALERQCRAAARIRGAAADVQAPPALRARLEAERQRAARPGGRWSSVAVAGVVAAAVVIAVVLAAL